MLDDAKAYANHAKKKAIDLDDVKLAVAMQMEQSFTTPPPREVAFFGVAFFRFSPHFCSLFQILMEVARTKNCIPLPAVKPHCGVRLPPDRYCLSACNYRLKTAKKPANKSVATLSGGASSSPRVGGPAAGPRAVVRPNSPAVRVQATPRTPSVKINTSGWLR